jgi:hypothetical protein
MRRKRVTERVRRKSRIMTATTTFLAFLITLKNKEEGLFIYKICYNKEQTNKHTHTHTDLWINKNKMVGRFSVWCSLLENGNLSLRKIFVFF